MKLSTLSSKVDIITAHDSIRNYADMANVSKVFAERFGYKFTVEETTGVKHKKASLLLTALTKEWVVWMDSDSMILNNIDELFEVDCDLIVSIKEPKNRSKKYGSYLYSGFVCARNTFQAKKFLGEWNTCPKLQKSDQRNLNELLGKYLDASIYEKDGEIVDFGGLKTYLLNPNIWQHQQAIHDMVAPEDYVKIIHFKGGLHRKWLEYKEMMCW